MHKGKGKANPRTGHIGPEGKLKYSFNISLTLVPDGGGRITPRPGRFTLVKETRYQLYRRLGVPHGRSERVQKISGQTGIRSPDRQARSRCYPGTYMVLHITWNEM